MIDEQIKNNSTRLPGLQIEIVHLLLPTSSRFRSTRCETMLARSRVTLRNDMRGPTSLCGDVAARRCLARRTSFPERNRRTSFGERQIPSLTCLGDCRSGRQTTV